MQNFRARKLRPPCLRRLGTLPPGPQNSPPIAKFWLRAWMRGYFSEAASALEEFAIFLQKYRNVRTTKVKINA